MGRFNPPPLAIRFHYLAGWQHGITKTYSISLHAFYTGVLEYRRPKLASAGQRRLVGHPTDPRPAESIAANPHAVG